MLLVAPTLRGQNSGSSKRDSAAFIYVDTLPLPSFPPSFSFFSSFSAACSFSQCLRLFNSRFPFSPSLGLRDAVSPRQYTVQRDYLCTVLFSFLRLFLSSYCSLFCPPFSVTLSLRVASLLCDNYLLGQNEPVFREARLQKYSSLRHNDLTGSH